MKIDIWSDIRCPFCYIGKKKLEKALETFPNKNSIEIIWHHFELDPNLTTDPTLSVMEYFEKTKGISASKVEQMFQNVQHFAKEDGLTMDMHNQKIANSFKAHLLLQFAKEKNIGNEMKEKLFIAQLVEGKNIDDYETLLEIGSELNFSEEEIKSALSSELYKKKVREDENSARELGINSVPFFVFNSKYAISGAQPVHLFSEVLEKTWMEIENIETQKNNSNLSCDINGNC